MKRALTIAGSDSGGGAGIQADLKTFAALGVYGTSALTAVTAQNTLGVTGVQELPPDMVALQIDAVVSDIGADAVKTGMLANSGIVRVVADKVTEHGLSNLVVDPVMVAKGGDPLLQEEAVDALRTLLVPLALVVTPNLPEASVLVGYRVATLEQARRAARDIVGYGEQERRRKGRAPAGRRRGRLLRRHRIQGVLIAPRGDDEHPRHGMHLRFGHCRGAGQRHGG